MFGRGASGAIVGAAGTGAEAGACPRAAAASAEAAAAEVRNSRRLSGMGLFLLFVLFPVGLRRRPVAEILGALAGRAADVGRILRRDEFFQLGLLRRVLGLGRQVGPLVLVAGLVVQFLVAVRVADVAPAVD